ncbi:MULTISPECIES: ECF transporter S component [Carnobacterium]|uniref:Membrane protein n=1 Tax=Carnobacterium inhibens subsp. gilichinskyi TaxID=1266845 RepID=U5S943_9LACT|nr:ECF transporter S component [Carnobacterium inhibens]AGY81750.1 membrane protein [Carnobacterium inhibens subsp. gilichinskyi]
MYQKNKSAYRTAILGILTAIIIIQNFVPLLGYIPIPPLNPTIIHITVIVVSLTLGTKDGMIIGSVWGITRMVKAFTMPASPFDYFLWRNPIIAVIPRIMVGLVAGYVYNICKKRMKNDSTAMIISSVLASLTNTIMVLGLIYIIYGETYASLLEVDFSNLLGVLGTVVLTSGIGEAIAAAIIAPIIARPLKKFRPQK